MESKKTEADWYDYGARFYDCQLGRFHTQDKFSEKYYTMSPYQYAANNPILYNDINGDSIIIHWQTKERRTGFMCNVFKYKTEQHSVTYKEGMDKTGNEFADNVINSLNELDKTLTGLGEGAGEFTTMISDMAADPESRVNVWKTDGYNPEEIGGKSRGGIKWNPNFGTFGDATHGSSFAIPPIVNLFHELGHKKFDLEHFKNETKRESQKIEHKRLSAGEEILAKFYGFGYRKRTFTGEYKANSSLSTEGKILWQKK